MNQILVIGLSGSIGALCRFWVANGIYAWLGRDFPYGTLLVNVSGCFLMGFLSEMLTQRFPLAPDYKAALLVGFLGAYTTFSTFSIETLYLFEQGDFIKAFFNVFLSVFFCLFAVWFGVWFGRKLFTGTDQNLNLLWCVLGANLAIAWLFGFGFESLAQKMEFSTDMRERGMILILGLMVTLMTYFSHSLKLGSPFLLFFFSSLSNVCAIWLGMLHGKQ